MFICENFNKLFNVQKKQLGWEPTLMELLRSSYEERGGLWFAYHISPRTEDELHCFNYRHVIFEPRLYITGLWCDCLKKEFRSNCLLRCKIWEEKRSRTMYRMYRAQKIVAMSIHFPPSHGPSGSWSFITSTSIFLGILKCCSYLYLFKKCLCIEFFLSHHCELFK